MNKWQIGRVGVTRIVEIEGPTRGTFLFAEATREKILAEEWLQPHFANRDGYFISSIHSFVIESEGRRIIVDTCVGNDKHRSQKFWHQLQTSFLADLDHAGFPAASIDFVVCTHLHVDHIGWNTRLDGDRWVPTFPNARYLFARREWEAQSATSDESGDDILGDSVRPIIEAGLCDLVEMNHRITSEVRLDPTPGHTPGHVSMLIESDSAEAVITGDLMHHPVQCAHPKWASLFDHDAAAAQATRRAFLGRFADSPVLILGTHFATPTAGHVVPDGDAWRFVVTTESN